MNPTKHFTRIVTGFLEIFRLGPIVQGSNFHTNCSYLIMALLGCTSMRWRRCIVAPKRAWDLPRPLMRIEMRRYRTPGVMVWSDWLWFLVLSLRVHQNVHSKIQNLCQNSWNHSEGTDIDWENLLTEFCINHKLDIGMDICRKLRVHYLPSGLFSTSAMFCYHVQAASKIALETAKET